MEMLILMNAVLYVLKILTKIPQKDLNASEIYAFLIHVGMRQGFSNTTHSHVKVNLVV